METRSSELGAQASSKHWRQKARGQDGLPGIPWESYTIITSHVETAGWLFFFPPFLLVCSTNNRIVIVIVVQITELVNDSTLTM